jgi:mannose-1-phosphate guanylyltransferase
VKNAHLPACAVLLAGGRGTRFWPRSRTCTPKQLLNIAGRETMIRETAARLHPLFPAANIWVVTNDEQIAAIRKELPGVPRSHTLSEPAGRNTAAAIGLAAIHLAHQHGDALMAVLPADSYIGKPELYRKILSATLDLARTPGNLVVVGVPPTLPETGYGYIERGAASAKPRGRTAFAVRRFTEKPELPLARKYLRSQRYFWNAGMFFWRVSTFLENLERYLPATRAALAELSRSIGTRAYEKTLRRIYPTLENISVDYAIMEPATRTSEGAASNGGGVYVLPAEVGWSDIGSWAAVYELLVESKGANVSAGPHFAHDAQGNYFWSPNKFVAAVGVHDLIVVETDDAILICPRSRAQDVGKVVKALEAGKRRELL